jgi:hypothetical protein
VPIRPFCVCGDLMDSDVVEDEGLSLDKLRRQFTDYAQAKRDEISEQRKAWRYYHCNQLTDEQRKILKERGQPEIVFNRTGRKINGLCGIIQKLRADPQAVQRNPLNNTAAQGAELATEVVRFILDASRWEFAEGRGLIDASVHGMCVWELGLEPSITDAADPDISVSRVDPTTFFYDQRSVAPDFGDVRFMGVYRWISDDELEDIYPEGAEAISGFGDVTGTDFDMDRAHLWIDSRGRKRLVEHWYKRRGQWEYCIYIGSAKLAHGVSPFMDEKGNTVPRYVAWSAMVDHDGDRYGFVRSMFGPQDAMNQHRSKAMHLMNSYKLFSRRGTFDDIEHVRKELHKASSVVEYNGERADWEYVVPSAEFIQQTQYFQDAKSEIENFGPSPALIDTGIKAKSGRALAMMQQNGIAELGPFLTNYRDAKLRLYKLVWQAAVSHWTGERWIRLSSDPEVSKFISVNAMQVGPDGFPQLINALGQIDVDIILDEGPDTTSVMGDIFDTMQSLAQSKIPIPPQVFIEMSNLPKSQKDKLLKLLEPKGPRPEQQAAMQLQMADTQATVGKKQAEIEKVKAETMSTMREMFGPQDDGREPDFDDRHSDDLGDALMSQAKAEELYASADLKRAQTWKTLQEAASMDAVPQEQPIGFDREVGFDRGF